MYVSFKVSVCVCVSALILGLFDLRTISIVELDLFFLEDTSRFIEYSAMSATDERYAIGNTQSSKTRKTRASPRSG